MPLFYRTKPKPDITICVFGYLGDQTLAESDWKECERIIQVNYTGAVSILNIVANLMQPKKMVLLPASVRWRVKEDDKAIISMAAPRRFHGLSFRHAQPALPS